MKDSDWMCNEDKLRPREGTLYPYAIYKMNLEGEYGEVLALFVNGKIAGLQSPYDHTCELLQTKETHNEACWAAYILHKFDKGELIIKGKESKLNIFARWFVVANEADPIAAMDKELVRIEKLHSDTGDILKYIRDIICA